MFISLEMLDEISRSNFSLSTKEVTFGSLVNNFENELGNRPFKVQYYKQFLDRTENSAVQLGKSITKLNDFFKEHKKFIENQNQIEYLADIITNISRSCADKNLEVLFQKVNYLNSCLVNNTKKYLKNLTELTLNPLEQLYRTNVTDDQRENLKKSLDKSFRAYESKRNKRRKSFKDLTASSHYNETSAQEDEEDDEKINLCLKTYEYLSQINKTKTSTFNQLYLCIFNYYKFQHGFAEESAQHLNEFLETTGALINDQARNYRDILYDNSNNYDRVSSQNPMTSSIMTVESQRQVDSTLVDFNFNQTSEKQVIDEKLKLFRLRKMKRNRAISTPFLNEITSDPIISLNSASQQLANNSLQNRSASNMTQRTQRKGSVSKVMEDPIATKSSTFGLGLFEQKRLKVMENLKKIRRANNNSGGYKTADPQQQQQQHETYNNQSVECLRSDEKSGYLLKRALHTRMGKSWLRRKCAAEKGFFCIYHHEEHKEPIRLNLGLCEIKPIGDRRFQVYYPNARCFIFMADSECELIDWVSVLNQAKRNFYDKGEKVNVDIQITTTLDKLLRLEGNGLCCDCGRPEADWLVTNLGVLVCIYCCGIHRDLGVHISKTQSIKIDKLTSTQLIIASLIGNAGFNRIFEATAPQNEKPSPECSTEMRYRFIKDKYERHKFVQHTQDNLDQLSQVIEFAKANSRERTFDLLLRSFGQDLNLMAPLVHDNLKRNLIQLSLIQLEEEVFLYIILFIVQNRDFAKSMYTMDYQDSNGYTALHYAAMYNRVESAKILLKAGCDVSIVSDYNQKPYDIAQQYGHIELMKQFQLHTEGKPIDSVKWLEPSDDEYLSTDSVDDEKTVFNDIHLIPKRVQRSRPLSMIENFNSSSNSPKTRSSFFYGYENRNEFKDSTHSLALEPIDYGDEFILRKKNTNLMEMDIGSRKRSLETPSLQRCKAITDHESSNPSHLSFKKYDLLVIETKLDQDFWFGYVEARPQKKGVFPQKLVNMYV